MRPDSLGPSADPEAPDTARPDAASPDTARSDTARSDMARSALAKASARLLPLLFLLYVVAYLDRVNVSFAALHMNRDLGLSDAAYGLGAGVFFLGYALFEIPSNLILERVGARRWMARIMVSWGLVSTAMALVSGQASFLALRLLLGLAEAGFFPGMILYLTYFFPRARRATAVSLFMAATAVAGLVGAPLSGLLLGLHGAWGLAGWRWMFVLEGIPAVILGLALLKLLPDRPAEASWLSPGERDALTGLLAAENREIDESGGARSHRVPALAQVREVLSRPVAWLLAGAYFAMVTAMYGLGLWMPQIISGLNRASESASDVTTGLLTAVPYLCAALGMGLVGASADKTGRPKVHALACLGLGAAGAVLSALSTGLAGTLAGFCLTAMGVWGMLGPFWSLATVRLGPGAAAAGIAFINCLGNVGGFLGPTLVGWLGGVFGGHGAGLGALALSLGLGFGALWLVPGFQGTTRKE